MVSSRFTRMATGALASWLALAAAATAQPQPARPSTQGTSPWQFGLYTGGQLSAPSASFNGLPGIPTCMSDSSSFSSGSGGGFSVAAMVGLRPSLGADFSSHFGATLRIGFTSSSTGFEASESIGPASDRSGAIVDVIDTYSLDATLSEIRLEPALTYQISADAPLIFSLGAKLGLLMGKTYEQSERVTSPSGARFADGSTERNANNGDLENTSSLLLGLGLGVGYDIWVSQTILIRPEVSGMLGLSSPVSDVTWSPHELRGGISILYTPLPPKANPLGN